MFNFQEFIEIVIEKLPQIILKNSITKFSVFSNYYFRIKIYYLYKNYFSRQNKNFMKQMEKFVQMNVKKNKSTSFLTKKKNLWNWYNLVTYLFLFWVEVDDVSTQPLWQKFEHQMLVISSMSWKLVCKSYF